MLIAAGALVPMLVFSAFESGSRTGRMIASAVAILAAIPAIIVAWRRGEVRLPLWLAAVGAVLVAIMISCVTSIDSAYSWKTFTRQHLGFMLLVPAAAWAASTARGQRLLLLGFALSGVIAAAPGIALYYHAEAAEEAKLVEQAKDFVWKTADADGVPYRRAKGMLKSYTRSAMVCFFALPALTLLALQAQRDRRFWRLLLVMLGAALVGYYLLLTKSRGAWLASAAVCLLTLLLARVRWWVLAIPVAAAALLLVAMPQERARAATMLRHVSNPDLLLSGRLDLWKQGLPALSANPWTGIGYGGNIFLRPAVKERGLALKTDRPQPDLHQFYLQTLAEVGTLGLAAYLTLLGLLLAAAWPAVRDPATLWHYPATVSAFATVVTLLLLGTIYCFNEENLAQILWTCAGCLGAMSFAGNGAAGVAKTTPAAG